MIFVTVGTQLPFDRLLTAIDQWAYRNRDHKVVAQTARTDLVLPWIDPRPFVNAAEFKRLVKEADVLVAHAGMGSILTALELGKPVIIMPRHADLGEHRNDHQLATAERLSHLANLQVANNADELDAALEIALKIAPADIGTDVVSEGHQRLLGEIRSFISAVGMDENLSPPSVS